MLAHLMRWPRRLAHDAGCTERAARLRLREVVLTALAFSGCYTPERVALVDMLLPPEIN